MSEQCNHPEVKTFQFCSHCNQIVFPEKSLDVFEIFELPRGFRIDLQDLEKKYYAISRKLHPDRFFSSNPEQQKNANYWASQVNNAYNLLKNKVLLAEHLVEKEGIKSKQTQPPLELAEDYFDFQDSINEVSVDKRKHLANSFALKIITVLKGREKQFESQTSKETVDLPAIATLLNEINYLKSMHRDLEAKWLNS